MSGFRPSARVTAPDGREWEIYAYKLRLPRRQPYSPDVDAPGFSALSIVTGVLGGILYVLAWVPLLFVRLFVDLPPAIVRALRTDEWTIEAVSWAPYPLRYRWTTPSETKGQVLAGVEGQLARGGTPMPRNAKQIL
jgi:hypothetical protein